MKKLLAILLIFSMAIFILTACKDNNDGTNNGNETPDAENGNSTETDENNGNNGEVLPEVPDAEDTETDGSDKPSDLPNDNFDDTPVVDDPTVDFENGWSQN